jgi:hypothetical protein
LNKLCIFIFLFVSIFLKAEGYPSLEEQVVSLEKEMESLKNKKNDHLKKITFHQGRGRDWQFSKDNYLESRREYFLAEKEIDRVRLIELKLKDLEELRQDLLE